MPLFPSGGGFSLNNVSSDTWHAFLRSWELGLLGVPRSVLREVPGRVGKTNSGGELSSRLVSLDLTIADVSRVACMNDASALATALDPRNGVANLQFTDDMPGWQLGVLIAQDSHLTPQVIRQPDGYTSLQFTLDCEAPDPYWYSTSASTFSWIPTATNQTHSITNAGTADTPGVWTLTYRAGATGVLTGINITIAQTALQAANGIASSYTFGYAGSIGASDTVVINTKQWTLTKNGVNDIANWTGTFPNLPAGTSTLTWQDTNSIGGNISMAYTVRRL